MEKTPKYYATLFNAVTKALEELEARNYGIARDLLVHGQCRAEGEFIAESERLAKSR